MIGAPVDAFPLWQFPSLAGVERLAHFVSTRDGGVSLAPYSTANLGFHVSDDATRVAENRKRLAAALGLAPEEFVMCRQVHGSEVLVVEAAQPDGFAADFDTLPAADALVTRVPGLMLTLLYADCLPVLVVDPARRVAGIAHAGWKGTISQIALALVQLMVREYGCAPGEMIAALGPSIGPCCYEIGSEVIGCVRRLLPNGDRFLAGDPSSTKAYFDLWRANETQLESAGIPQSQIEVARVCTKCHSGQFFSDRAERPTGRFAAGIMLN